MDYYLPPDFVAGIYDRLIERKLPRLKVAVDAGVDMVTVTGDFARSGHDGSGEMAPI